MERNGSTGGDDSKFEEMMQEAGLGDGFTPPKIHVPKSCEDCPLLVSEVEKLSRLASELYSVAEASLEGYSSDELSRATGDRRVIGESLEVFDGIVSSVQETVHILTRKCIGPVLTFGISDRTNAEVKAVVCDSPESDTVLGEVTIEEPVIIYRGRARTAEEFLYDFVKRHAKPGGSAGNNQDQ